MVASHTVVMHHHSVFLEESGPGTVVVTPVVHQSLKILVFMIFAVAFIASHLFIVSASSHFHVSTLHLIVLMIASGHVKVPHIVSVALSKLVEFLEPYGKSGPSPLCVITQPCLSHLTGGGTVVVLFAVELAHFVVSAVAAAASVAIATIVIVFAGSYALFVVSTWVGIAWVHARCWCWSVSAA